MQFYKWLWLLTYNPFDANQLNDILTEKFGFKRLYIEKNTLKGTIFNLPIFNPGTISHKPPPQYQNSYISPQVASGGCECRAL